MCDVFPILPSYSFIRPRWPSAGVQVVVIKDSIAHIWLPLVISVMCVTISYIFGRPWVARGCLWFCFGFLVVVALNVLTGTGVLLCGGRPS